eukprot:363169-Chlamydomonas_euryale.AAC.52
MPVDMPNRELRATTMLPTGCSQMSGAAAGARSFVCGGPDARLFAGTAGREPKSEPKISPHPDDRLALDRVRSIRDSGGGAQTSAHDARDGTNSGRGFPTLIVVVRRMRGSVNTK